MYFQFRNVVLFQNSAHFFGDSYMFGKHATNHEEVRSLQFRLLVSGSPYVDVSVPILF